VGPWPELLIIRSMRIQAQRATRSSGDNVLLQIKGIDAKGTTAYFDAGASGKVAGAIDFCSPAKLVSEAGESVAVITTRFRF
jgi:hypothetical protein